MRKAALILMLAVSAMSAPAMADSLTVGLKVLSDGDSVGRVYELLGKPDRVEELENKFGARLGERLEYYRNGKTIWITIRGGVVASIYEGT